MFKQQQKSALATWWETVNDRCNWFRLPGYELIRHLDLASEFLASGQIDETDFLEMREMAIAARDFAMEHISASWYQPKRLYDVVPLVTGDRIGEISHGIFTPVTAYERPGWNGQMYGRIRHEHDGRLMVRMYMGWAPDAEIIGSQLISESGDRFELVTTGVLIEGEQYPVIGDPTDFSAAVELLRWMVEEQHDGPRRQQLLEILHASPFRRCPECSNGWAMREDCAACTGSGFTAGKVASRKAQLVRPECPS